MSSRAKSRDLHSVSCRKSRMRAEVFFHHCFQSSLRPQDVFHRVTRSALAPRTLGDVVRRLFHFLTRVRDRNGQSAMLHYWKIDDVVADETRFFLAEAVTLQDLLHGREFIHASLLHVVQLKVT